MCYIRGAGIDFNITSFQFLFQIQTTYFAAFQDAREVSAEILDHTFIVWCRFLLRVGSFIVEKNDGS